MYQRAGMAAADRTIPCTVAPAKACHNCGELGHVSCECPHSGWRMGTPSGAEGGVGDSGKLHEPGRGGAPPRAEPDASAAERAANRCMDLVGNLAELEFIDVGPA